MNTNKQEADIKIEQVHIIGYNTINSNTYENIISILSSVNLYASNYSYITFNTQRLIYS